MRLFSLSIFLFITTLISFEPVIAEEKFRVCADPLHPPYSTKDGKGFEDKIAKLFADELGKEIEYYWFPQRIGFLRNTLKSQLPNSEEYRCDIVMGVPTGYELAITTRPYYHSTYVMLIAKNRDWEDIRNARQIAQLDEERISKLRIAMFDRGPGTAWLQKNGLIDNGIPYQTMTGDHENNTAMQIDKDIRSGKIDMVILWGPMAGYVISNSPENSYTVIPMESTPGMKFDFSISMGVRHGDKKRLTLLNELIAKKENEIHQILSQYNFPLLPIPEQKHREDDDDD